MHAHVLKKRTSDFELKAFQIGHRTDINKKEKKGKVESAGRGREVKKIGV